MLLAISNQQSVKAACGKKRNATAIYTFSKAYVAGKRLSSPQRPTDCQQLMADDYSANDPMLS